MKLSVWSSYYIGLSPEDTMRNLKSHGFDYCEISLEHSIDIMNRGNIKQESSVKEIRLQY